MMFFSQFLGVWYPIMRLRGSSTPDSAVVRYEVTGLGQLVYTVTGQVNRSHILRIVLPLKCMHNYSCNGC